MSAKLSSPAEVIAGIKLALKVAPHVDGEQYLRELAALASPTSPQPAGGGVDDAMVECIAELIAAQMPSEIVIQRCVALAVNKYALAAIKGDSHAG